MAYNPNLPAGLAAAAGSAPVVLATDQTQDFYITGAATQSSLGNNVLLATAGTGSLDTFANGNTYRSMYVQINASAGVSAGQIIFEFSNDNATWFPMQVFEETSVANTFLSGAQGISAASSKMFSGKINGRYIRCRISTGFSGGTIQAFTKLSPTEYVARYPNVLANVTGIISLSPRGGGGSSVYTGSIGATATAVRTSSGQLYGYDILNPNASVSYVQFFNATVANVTLGTTAPFMSLGVPANGNISENYPLGVAFGTAITVAVTTTRTGSTGPSSTVDLNIIYT